MRARARQWMQTFFDPRPDPAFARRMDAARRLGVMESLDARSGTREARRHIDSIYDRTVTARPNTREGQDNE